MTEQEETMIITEEISPKLHEVITDITQHAGWLDKNTPAYKALTQKEKQSVDKVMGENLFGVYSENEVWFNIVLMLHTGKFVDARQSSPVKLFDKVWMIGWTMLVTTPQETLEYTIKLEPYLPYTPLSIDVECGDMPSELVAHLLYLALLDCESSYDYDTRQQMVQRSKEKMIERYIERRKSEEE